MDAATARMTLASRLRVLGLAYLSREHAPDVRASAEFARLFEDRVAGKCPPCQSAFLSPLVHSPRKLASLPNKALTWYRRFGFGSLAQDRPADHIGLLLTFAGHLLDADPSPAMLVSFSTEHLLWIDDFCERLSVEARHPFYQELAESTRVAVRTYAGHA
jgi:TorA maturation chaperone TorD